MNPAVWTTLTLAIIALAIATAAIRHPNTRWEALHYHATTARWGIGPVGDGHWRGTLGISIVLAGHGYALFRWPREVLHHPYRPCTCKDCP
ncbi:hypothetical protein [Streptomyces misionensis]|uniref:hypothetical protein n=1 Tax=Streptomyces misionensis TaxID=67331 RepID=UPI00396B9B4B